MEDLTDRVEDLTDRTRNLMGMQENRALRYGLSFAAGVGVGVGVGLLLAPASGEETRSTIAGKVQEAGTRVRDRFSPAMGATGTETRWTANSQSSSRHASRRCAGSMGDEEPFSAFTNVREKEKKWASGRSYSWFY
jgi:hypothetical protein